MTPIQKQEALAGLEELKRLIGGIPAVAIVGDMVIELIEEAVRTVGDDPEQVRLEESAGLKAAVAAAVKAKFPNG